MAARTNDSLHYGVGRMTGGWFAFVLVSLAFVALGLYAYSFQATEGEIVTGMRDLGVMGGAPWGIYVAFVVYFVGVSFAGITVAALIRLFNLEHLKPISRMAELMTIIALILGGLSIMADVGKPLRALLYLPMYGRPMSPFFGTFTLVISGYLFASLVYFYLDGRRDAAIFAKRAQGVLQTFYRLWAAGYRDTPAERERHQRATYWLALAILPLLVVAHSTLGVVFGLQVGRPGWNSALQAPGFVILAGVSGIGHLIILAALCRAFVAEKDQIGPEIFKWLGNVLMALIFVYLYFMAVELLTSAYQASHHEAKLTAALMTGRYSGLMWLSIASLAVPAVLLAVQFVRGSYSVSVLVLCGILVNIAAIGKRYLIVVPSQTHGTLLPYGVGTYTPTWVELSVILGLLGLGAFLYIAFVKVFPIMAVPDSAKGGE
ncbi:MAG: NrfD/PsrC family molybdoenzyme membrane anchor subunit [bacterium]